MHNDGIYSGQIQGMVTTERKDKELVEVTLSLTHIANAQGEWDEYPADTIRLFLYLTDSAKPHTLAKLRAMGFNGDFITPQFSEVGIALRCECKEHEGKMKSNWDLASWGGASEPIGEDKARRLNAWWDAENRTNAPPAGRPAIPPAAAPPVGEDKDGIPF